jgi:hypothetical protein
MGIIDEELKKLRMAGQMPVALATGSAGYAIGSTPAPRPVGPPPIALNNIEAPASDRPPMSLAGNVGPEPMPGTPPSLNLRQMHDELLGKSLEVKLSRQPDSGDIQELRKTIITPGQAPAGMAEAFRSPGFAGAATPDTAGMAPAGLRENFGIRMNPITGEMVRGMALDTGRPPAGSRPDAGGQTPASPSASILAAYPDLRPTEANPMPAKMLTDFANMTHEARAGLRRQAIDDQLRREAMASGERVAKSQADAIAAKAAADRAARVDVASIGAGAKTEAATIGAEAKTGVATTTAEAARYKADQALKAQELRSKSFADMTDKRIQSQQDLVQLKHDLDADQRQGYITLPGGNTVLKVGTSLIDPESGKTVYEGKSGDSLAQLMLAIQGEKTQPTSQTSKASWPGQKPIDQITPPRPDAKQAADGKWYIPDPNRPGKYLQVT